MSLRLPDFHSRMPNRDPFAVVKPILIDRLQQSRLVRRGWVALQPPAGDRRGDLIRTRRIGDAAFRY